MLGSLPDPAGMLGSLPDPTGLLGSAPNPVTGIITSSLCPPGQ
jgi:hypothetical protein